MEDFALHRTWPLRRRVACAVDRARRQCGVEVVSNTLYLQFESSISFMFCYALSICDVSRYHADADETCERVRGCLIHLAETADTLESKNRSSKNSSANATSVASATLSLPTAKFAWAWRRRGPRIQPLSRGYLTEVFYS